MDTRDHENQFADAFQLEGELAIPKSADGAVFNAPWEGEAFAIPVKLNEDKRIVWREFAEYLSTEVTGAGTASDGTDYYAHWLKACEKLLTDKGLLDADEISRRCDEIVESRRHHHKPD